jgi:hypothetical protein
MSCRRLGVLTIVLAIANVSCASLTDGPRFASALKTGTVETPLVKEASGIIASRKNVGVLWVHNDSGDAPRLYAFNTTGKLLGTCTVTGAQARDWEDIAAGPGPEPNQSYLYIGDIGDNNARYPSVRVYRVPEPNVEPAKLLGQIRSAPAETIELTYPDGPRDAETLLVDPQTRDIYIVAKRELFCKVYMAAYPQSTTKPTTMTRVAALPWPIATGGDVSPDGRYVIVRSYYNASLWTRPAGEPLWKAFTGPRVDLPLANEPQGEAISFDATGRGYFTISEKANPAIYYFKRTENESDRGLADVP